MAKKFNDDFDVKISEDKNDPLIMHISVTEKIVYLGRSFYLKTERGVFLRKITWTKENLFEWRFGWGRLSDLKPNENPGSKVLLILDQTK